VRSSSSATGATSRWAKSRTVRWMSRWSSERSKSMRAILTKARSALDDPQRLELRHAAGQPGPLHHVHHPLDVLVGERGLLSQAPVGRAADHDPAGLQLAPQLGPADLLARAGTAHPPAGPVAGGAERALHGAGQAGEDEARGPHAPWDEHRLVGERPGGALAVHAQLPPAV